MLKILEKNSTSEVMTRYWKQFVGWVIDLRNKYWSDIFFRTELNVIGLQIAFALVLAIMLSVSLNYFYRDILQTILEGISESIKSNNTFTSAEVLNSIKIVKAKNFIGFFGLTGSITLIFGYVIARITLSPAREALKTQKRFVSDIAHELRTPISVIKTNSEVALLDDSHSEKVRKIFKNNIEELDRVSTIINNLLTFNNLVHPEQKKFVLVNVSDVIDSSIKKLDELIKKKEIKIITKKISPYTIRGNAIALEQIVINLVKNAINYNNTGGFVSITVEPDYVGNISLTVEDNGMGIAQSDLVHIFEPFYRAEKSRNRHLGSSGLGLTIVSELVKLHSGRISVKSHLKEGTIITILFPYTKNEEEEEINKQKNKVKNEISVDYLKKKV